MQHRQQSARLRGRALPGTRDSCRHCALRRTLLLKLARDSVRLGSDGVSSLSTDLGVVSNEETEWLLGSAVLGLPSGVGLLGHQL